MIAAIPIALLLVIVVGVAAHARRYRTRLTLLRSQQGQRVTLGITTHGQITPFMAVEARIDKVDPVGFSATCRLTPYAMRRQVKDEWQAVASFIAAELEDGILVDRIVWLETDDGTRYNF